MNKFETAYRNILNNHDAHLAFEEILPFFFKEIPNFGKLDENDFISINPDFSDMDENFILTEDVFKRSLFTPLLNKMKNSGGLCQIPFNKVKQYLGNKLKPIRHEYGIIYMEVNNPNDYVLKLSKIFRYEIISQNADLFSNLYKRIVNSAGGCYNGFTNFDYIFLFSNCATNNINKDHILMHELIHYIQNITGRNIPKQKTKIEYDYQNDKKEDIFCLEELITYLNTFCYEMETCNFSKDKILSGIASLIDLRNKFKVFFPEINPREYNNPEKLRSARKERADSFVSYARENNSFYKEALNILHNKNEPCSGVDYVVFCICYNKHISSIKSHVIHYFK